MLLQRSLELTLVTAFALVLSGCAGGDTEFTEVGHDESEVADDDHGHGHHGPNGGEIVEVGNEEFHAEVVVDEASHQVDIYILGSDAQTAKPIEATEISLSFKHGDEIEDFKLSAAPLDGESDGQSSKFTLTSEELFEELHEHSEGATLTFTAGEETLTGTVTHSHDHDHGHHEHGEEGSHGDHDHGDKHADGDKDADGHEHGKDHDGDKRDKVEKADSGDSNADKAPAKDEAAEDKPDQPKADNATEKPAAETPDAGNADEKKE